MKKSGKGGKPIKKIKIDKTVSQQQRDQLILLQKLA
jgi:tRNA(Ile)-lysidine synthetase-like protein